LASLVIWKSDSNAYACASSLLLTGFQTNI